MGGGLRTAEVFLGESAPAVRVSPTGSVRLATDGFTMVAATWRGPRAPRLRVRVRVGDRWGAWRELDELVDAPTPRDREAVRARRDVDGASDLLWVGRHREIQVDSRAGSLSGVRLVLSDTSAVGAVNEEPTPSPTPTPTPTPQPEPDPDESKPERAPKPHLRTRRDWGADERWRENDPTYGTTIKQVHVHHTVNANNYARRDVPGILRAIYRYHTKSLGWSDIGYNVLVDRFGRAWVGRWGGVAKRVQGAHTLGFNHNSTGVAVIGNFETVKPRKAVRVTLSRIAAWLLDRDDSEARGKVLRISHGSDKYRAGRRVRLPIIDGHRDTNDTACPGKHLYRVLPSIRGAAQARIDRFD